MGLGFTVKDASGQDHIYNDIHTPSGTVKKQTTTEETQVDIENIDISQAPGMSISSSITEAVSQYVEVSIQSLIAGGTANIMDQIGVNQETMELANRMLSLMDSAVFKINSILKFVPKNIHTSPGAKAAMSTICCSFKDIFMAAYAAAENLYYEKVNDAITNLPSAQEALKDAQELLMNLAIQLVDEQFLRYFGISIVEMYYQCRPLIAKFKQWQQYKRFMAGEGYDATIEFNMEVDPSVIKAQLLEELTNCTDLVYNGFMILQIKDAFEQIKMLVSQFNDIDLRVLADGINTLDDLINLLDEIGLNNRSAVITIDQAIKLGINAFQDKFNHLSDSLIDQAIASGTNIASAAIDSTTLTARPSITQTFKFTNNNEDRSITLTIFENPSKNTIKKGLTTALSNTKDSEGKNIFEASDVLTILNTVDKCVLTGKDETLSLTHMTFHIHLELNTKSKKKDNIYDQIQETVSTTNTSEPTYELGMIEEEYTLDPNAKKRRPTLQLCHELYAVLSEVFPLLKTFATLVSNYKINKAKVENNAKGNLFGMIKVIAKINKLLKSVNKSNKNFFTIRSLKLYDYVNNNIKRLTDITVELNAIDTRNLYLYLKANGITCSSIDLKKNTVLYIDNDTLNDQREERQRNLDKASQYFGDDSKMFVDYPKCKYEDGTTLGIDKIEETDDEVFYSDSSLPIYGSEIMRCFSRGYDPLK